jgi:hypothetical protein
MFLGDMFTTPTIGEGENIDSYVKPHPYYF